MAENDLGEHAGIYQGNGGPVGCRHPYFVAHLAQISGGNAQVNAVNSTDLVWSSPVRDQEDGGSNPLAPTIYFAISNLQALK